MRRAQLQKTYEPRDGIFHRYGLQHYQKHLHYGYPPQFNHYFYNRFLPPPPYYASPYSEHYFPSPQDVYNPYFPNYGLLNSPIQTHDNYQQNDKKMRSVKILEEEEAPIIHLKEEPKEEESIVRHLPLPRKTKRATKKSKVQRKDIASGETYYWTPDENRRYYNFLKHNYELFRLSKLSKKKTKVNVQMSNRVRTRTSSQCHSHHQKMVKKYGSIEEILKNMIPATEGPKSWKRRLNAKEQSYKPEGASKRSNRRQI